MIYQDMSLITKQLGLEENAAEYHSLLLSRYFIHDPQDEQPQLLMAFYLGVLIMVSFSLVLIIAYCGIYRICSNCKLFRYCLLLWLQRSIEIAGSRTAVYQDGRIGNEPRLQVLVL